MMIYISFHQILMWNMTSPPIKASIIILLALTTMNLTFMEVYSSNLTFIMDWKILSFKSVDLSLIMMIDKMNIMFSSTVMIISMSVMWFTTSYMSKDQNLEYFTIMVMMFVLSMNLLIFFPNLVMILLGWDGLGLTSYLLVIYYMNSKSLSAGMLTALSNRLGDAFLIISISWALMAGHWNFMFSYNNVNLFICFMIILAAMTKSAQMPFSAWLPAAMAAPTPVSALVHSSTLVTAGVYLIIRFYPSLSIFPTTKFMCFYLGAITCMMASTSATFENDLKKIIALSTLSQLGIMMMSLGMELPLLAFFHLITHAMFKALLFICAGTMIHIESSNQDIRLMGNLSGYMNIYIMFMNVANLSLCGAPFLAGFYSKDIIVETFFITNMPISTSFILMSSICMTSAYTMRLSIFTLWSYSKNLNFVQYCSKFTYLPQMTLLMGTIMGGAAINLMIISSPSTPTLPMMLKMLTLTLIIMMASMMWLMINSKMSLSINKFLSSMWFLTYISSNPINNMTMKLSQNFIYNESTWMEKISGKGMADILSKTSKNTQLMSKLNMSEMLTYSGVMIFLLTSISMMCNI